MEKNFYINLGKKLKELRNEAGKTQKEIADFLNMSRSNYSRFELGIREISFLDICKLTKYYNVSLNEISEYLNF